MTKETEYGWKTEYLTKNGKPWIPVMGEMHYSRYRRELWEESLRKMKAGGVEIVSTYVIWIHHEEEEGIFRFDGCRDVGEFLRLCQKTGLKVFLRLGPWVHGEVRNGGFPDWLQAKEKEGVVLRSNDASYLGMVRRFWEHVYVHVQGMFHKDGGPVIGVQIENEYGHVGGQTGAAGEAHMRTLTELAKSIGYQVPYYTATGWGGACIGDLLPVMGGYCEAPWDQRTTELEANTNYVFSSCRNDALIASDHHKGEQLTFDPSRFPYLTAELGGGLQPTSHRRPVTTGKDIGAMSVVKLGSGAAMLGYYMYHGGSNPKGRRSTLQESKATGYLNDLPEINYDFFAPVRQYGQISDTYREIHLLAAFLQDFGEDLASLPARFPQPQQDPENTEKLRWSVRSDGTHGYVFFNNYQRKRSMKTQNSVRFQVSLEQEEVTFPPVTLEDGAFGFFPCRMKLGSAVLRTALAVPFCRLKNAQGEYFVFYGDKDPCFQWEGEEQAQILLLTREQAKHAWKVTLDQEYLILAPDYVWAEEDGLKVTGGPDTRILCWPRPQNGIGGFEKTGEEGIFAVYERKLSPDCAQVSFEKIPRKTGAQGEEDTYRLTVNYAGAEERRTGRDTLLHLDYLGESMEIFCGGGKIEDHFYTGEKLTLSLGYFDFPKELEIRIRPLRRGAAIFLEQWPEFAGASACALLGAEAEEVYR